ncbi:MAG TPA: isoprenylcysteine carboxylmethyltransferase family protein [Acidobacteriaceae bacterium]|nr:isoprenylcysteine carboxylmethyltransferase family protein [Acidobacteriaceae bacterium]
MKANVSTFAAIVLLSVWLALHVSSVAWTPVRVVGAVIATVGMLLLVTARIQLGRSFSVSAQARKLVTTGIYSRIRNPIYFFSAMFLCGVAIAIGRPILLLVLLALLPLQVWRARKEEQVLTEAFGEEYVRYKARTWF